MSEVVVHRLSTKDLTTMTGECSVCGFVAIARSGRGFQCGVKKKQNTADWRKRNPGKSAADRRRRSEHELHGRDYVARTALCMICGPTDLVHWGRGDICGNRARELRSVQQTESQRSCKECQIIDGDRVWLNADGSCPRCADASLASLSGPTPRSDEFSRLDHDYGEAGFSVHHYDSYDDYDDDRQPAVPGWKTIGSTRPWNEV